jgi:hypothetical protein
LATAHPALTDDFQRPKTMLSDISCIPASGVSRLSNHEVSFGEEEFEIWNFAKITNPL